MYQQSFASGLGVTADATCRPQLAKEDGEKRKMSIADGHPASNDKKISLLGKFKLCKYSCGKKIAWAEDEDSRAFWVNEDGITEHDCPNKPYFTSRKQENYYHPASRQDLSRIARINTTEQAAARALSIAEKAQKDY